MPSFRTVQQEILLNTEIEIVDDDVEEGGISRPACCKSAELSCNLQVFGADLFNGDIEGLPMILVAFHLVGLDSTDFCWGWLLSSGLSEYLQHLHQQDKKVILREQTRDVYQ